MSFVIKSIEISNLESRVFHTETKITKWDLPITGSNKLKPGKRIKNSLLGIVICSTVYVGIYCVLSYYGGYDYNQSGKLRYRSIGLAVSDISTWNPKGCRYQAKFKNTSGNDVSRGNVPGYFFSPLIKIDRNYFHPTESLIEP